MMRGSMLVAAARLLHAGAFSHLDVVRRVGTSSQGAILAAFIHKSGEMHLSGASEQEKGASLHLLGASKQVKGASEHVRGASL